MLGDSVHLERPENQRFIVSLRKAACLVSKKVEKNLGEKEFGHITNGMGGAF